ncbi:AraC family transcriptional regulator [Planctobacterium marinum]|uniref:HTH araC/xylS-type domain-containing protein n=1 Tax=Planctobacterium marinum TaxID=1631968 RepID=A0AA48HW76_9ALTE|nr:hypothetical protein MACH26_25090 [Planctobacterium marinum]
MGYQEYEAKGPLADVVEAFWCYQPALSGPKWDILIPEGVVDVIFNFGAPYYRQPFASYHQGEWVSGDVFIGQRSDLFKIRWPHNTKLFSIRVKPAAAYQLCATPMVALTNRAINLIQLGLMALSQRLKSIGFANKEQLVETCHQMLPDLIRPPGSGELNVKQAIQLIEQRQGELDVKTVCGQLAMSSRTLERQFQQYVGLTPKYFIRVKRLHYFLYQHNGERNDVMDAAFDAQYYDQSHFIREFRSFTGETPHAFFKSPPEIYQPLLTSLNAQFERNNLQKMK